MPQNNFSEWWDDQCELKNIRYFSPSELLFLGGSNSRLRVNTPPPRRLWPNIIPAVILCDKIRHKFGEPLKVLSAYRNPAYNSAIGGARHSKHKDFLAVDLTPVRGSVFELQKIAIEMRNKRNAGGVGSYSWGVHVDGRDRIASW